MSDSDDQRWKPVFERVKVIFNNWDPMGVVEDGIFDEYDSYAMKVAGMKIRSESKVSIIRFLTEEFSSATGIEVSKEEAESLVEEILTD